MSANESETIEDIASEMRKVKGFSVPYAPSGYNGVWTEDLVEFADRIESAWKREAKAIATENAVLPAVCITKTSGNAAATREALVQCELFLGNVTRHGHPTLNPGDKCTACEGADELRGMVCRALSKPPRNCDVMDWRTAWAKWRTENHPQKPVGYSECYESTTMFMDWYTGTAEREGDGDGR